MALLFMDSFDHYEAADILTKWTSNAYPASISMETALQRTGTQALKLTGASSRPYVLKGLADAFTTIYLGFAFRTSVFDSSYTAYGTFFQLMAAEGVACGVTVGIDGSLSIYRGYPTSGMTSAAFTIQGVTGSILTLNAWQYLEFKIVYHDTVGGMSVKVNGVEAYSDFTLDVKNSLVGSPTSIRLCAPATTNAVNLFDDFWIDSAAFHGDCIITTLYPGEGGAHSDWLPDSGTNASQVEEELLDSDTTFNSSGTLNHRDSFPVDAISGSNTVHAVAVNVVARRTEEGSAAIQPFVHNNLNDYDSTDFAVVGSYGDAQYIWEEDPSAAEPSAWTDETINASEFGVLLSGV